MKDFTIIYERAPSKDITYTNFKRSTYNKWRFLSQYSNNDMNTATLLLKLLSIFRNLISAFDQIPSYCTCKISAFSVTMSKNKALFNQKCHPYVWLK